jgi:hypothetical protein
MSGRSSRHKLMQAIVRASSHYGTDPAFNHVESELGELGKCSRLQPLNRQRLLQVIHASRALDTCLSTILTLNGKTPKTGIGGMLSQLQSLPTSAPGHIPPSAAAAFRPKIAHKRNRYAHTAGAFPSSTTEADAFVAEVHACLSMVL